MMYINTSYKLLYNAATAADLDVHRVSAIDDYPAGAATLYEFHLGIDSIIDYMDRFNLLMTYLSRRNRLVFGRITCFYKFGKKPHWVIRVPIRLRQRGEQ